MRKVSRRALARSLCATAASATLASAIGSIVSSSAAVGEEFPADPRTVELWMDQWMKRDRIAVGSLHSVAICRSNLFSDEAHQLDAKSWSGEFCRSQGASGFCDGFREHSSNFLVNSSHPMESTRIQPFFMTTCTGHRPPHGMLRTAS